jgi:hypothetical protein
MKWAPPSPSLSIAIRYSPPTSSVKTKSKRLHRVRRCSYGAYPHDPCH